MQLLLSTLIAILAAGAATASFLAFRLRMRVRVLEIAAREESENIRTILEMLDGAVDHLSEEVHEAGERAGVLVAPTTPRSGLNLGKRSQALRLHRHGETLDRIASNLELPRAEVKLLLKIHQLVLKLA